MRNGEWYWSRCEAQWMRWRRSWGGLRDDVDVVAGEINKGR